MVVITANKNKQHWRRGNFFEAVEKFGCRVRHAVIITILSTSLYVVKWTTDEGRAGSVPDAFSVQIRRLDLWILNERASYVFDRARQSTSPHVLTLAKASNETKQYVRKLTENKTLIREERRRLELYKGRRLFSEGKSES